MGFYGGFMAWAGVWRGRINADGERIGRGWCCRGLSGAGVRSGAGVGRGRGCRGAGGHLVDVGRGTGARGAWARTCADVCGESITGERGEGKEKH